MKSDALYFDSWLGYNYNIMREKLSTDSPLNEDAFHDAYLIARQRLTRKDESDYASLMFLCYGMAKRLSYRVEFQYFKPNPLFFDFLQDEVSEPAKHREQPNIQKVDKVCKECLSNIDYQLFRLKFHDRVPMRVLQEFFGLSKAELSGKISFIKSIIKSQFT